MTLTQLNYIIAVDRCRNFAQAAKECFVTQPTLSMQVQKLEDYLQIIIFDRTQTPVVPTPMGEKVLDYARKIMRESYALEELSKSLRGEISGEFTLSVIPTLAPYVIPMFVEKFVEKYPKVELKIYEHQTDEIIKFLREGKIDGAILATPLEVKDIKEEELFLEPFQVFLSPKHELLKKKTIAESDLDMKDAWLLKEGHCMRAQALHLCQFRKKGGEHKLFFEAGSMETLINMVKSTHGFTVLPYLAAKNLSPSDQKQLRDFKNSNPVREISFVTGPYSLKTSITEALMKSIKENLPSELKKSSRKAAVVPL